MYRERYTIYHNTMMPASPLQGGTEERLLLTPDIAQRVEHTII